MTAILEIAQRHGLLVIEDACEAIGAEHHGRRVGSMGNAGVFAFYPNKQITTGEGGVVVTRDEALARRIRALRNQGRYESDDWFQHTELGYNYRISEINCALGLAQMARLEEILQKRADVASAYHRRLSRYHELFSSTACSRQPAASAGLSMSCACVRGAPWNGTQSCAV